MVHGLETSKAASSEDSTTPSAKALGHTARLNPRETPVDVFSELLYFAKAEAAEGMAPECFCKDVLEPNRKCLYCRSTLAISQLWKERNSHYQLLSAAKAFVRWVDSCWGAGEILHERTLTEYENAKVAIAQAEEGL